MSEKFEKTDPEMVRMYPKVHAVVIDSLGTQLIEARKQIDRLLAELGEERHLNGELHTDRDYWQKVARHMAKQEATEMSDAVTRIDWKDLLKEYEQAVRGE